jgi:hypothetical protein
VTEKETALRTPFNGPGVYLMNSLEIRIRRVEECFAHGPPTFEKVQLPGYSQMSWRCTRCKMMKRDHARK